MCDQFDAAWTVLKLLITPLVSAIAGGFVGHWLATKREIAARSAVLVREAEIRRRTFRKFALKFRYDLERISHLENERVWDEYAKRCSDLMAEASLVVGDYSAPDEFLRLAKRAGEWRREDAVLEAQRKGCTLRDVLRDSIVEVADFEVLRK